MKCNGSKSVAEYEIPSETSLDQQRGVTRHQIDQQRGVTRHQISNVVLLDTRSIMWRYETPDQQHIVAVVNMKNIGVENMTKNY